MNFAKNQLRAVESGRITDPHKLLGDIYSAWRFAGYWGDGYAAALAFSKALDPGRSQNFPAPWPLWNKNFKYKSRSK
jgi:phage tail sheath gpL-like